MNNNTGLIIVGTVVLALVVGGIVVLGGGSDNGDTSPGKLDTFTQCLKDSGTTFFGAFWCPHCQAQKKMFGTSAKLLPYVECSTPDGTGRLQICVDNNIESYPTWEFPDKSRLTGEVSLAELSEKTGCVLPGSAEETAEPASAGESSPVE